MLDDAMKVLKSVYKTLTVLDMRPKLRAVFVMLDMVWLGGPAAVLIAQSNKDKKKHNPGKS